MAASGGDSGGVEQSAGVIQNRVVAENGKRQAVDEIAGGSAVGKEDIIEDTGQVIDQRFAGQPVFDRVRGERDVFSGVREVALFDFGAFGLQQECRGIGEPNSLRGPEIGEIPDSAEEPPCTLSILPASHSCDRRDVGADRGEVSAVLVRDQSEAGCARLTEER